MTERLHFHFSLSCIGGGNGNPLQCSCLENPRDGGAWWAAIYGITQSRTQLKQLSSSSSRELEKPDLPPEEVHLGERNRARHVGILKKHDISPPLLIPPKYHLCVLRVPPTRMSLVLGLYRASEHTYLPRLCWQGYLAKMGYTENGGRLVSNL